MLKDKRKKDKKYMIYANEYHFIIMAIEQITKNKDKDFIIFSEKDLREHVYKLLENLEIEEENKEKILQVFYYGNIEEKISKITKALKTKKCIIIQGNNKYIKYINKILEELSYKNEKIEIIDCYNFYNNLENKELDKEYNAQITTDLINK